MSVNMVDIHKLHFGKPEQKKQSRRNRLHFGKPENLCGFTLESRMASL